MLYRKKVSLKKEIPEVKTEINTRTLLCKSAYTCLTMCTVKADMGKCH